MTLRRWDQSLLSAEESEMVGTLPCAQRCPVDMATAWCAAKRRPQVVCRGHRPSTMLPKCSVSPTPPDVTRATMLHCRPAVAFLLCRSGRSGYLTIRRWRPAIWLGAALSLFHLARVISGLLSSSRFFHELSARSQEFRLMQFVLLTIGLGMQAGLLLASVVADRSAARRTYLQKRHRGH